MFMVVPSCRWSVWSPGWWRSGWNLMPPCFAGGRDRG